MVIDSFVFCGTRNIEEKRVFPACTTNCRNSIDETHACPYIDLKKNKFEGKTSIRQRIKKLIRTKPLNNQNQYTYDKLPVLNTKTGTNDECENSEIHQKKRKVTELRKNNILNMRRRVTGVKHNKRSNDSVKEAIYLIGEEIGKGSYASVHIGMHKPTLARVAFKMYDKKNITSEQRMANINREIQNLAKLKHPNIVRLLDSYENQTHIILALEYVDGISLSTYLKNRADRILPEFEAKFLFKQIVSGIAYCHKLGVVHRDIKLDNIIVSNKKTVKILDFGFSNAVSACRKVKIYCGTPAYMAPELLSHEEIEGEPTDVWALGVVLYAMLCGTLPFKGSCREELFDSIREGKYTIPSYLSSKAAQLIAKMLSLNIRQRPTAANILADKWFEYTSASVFNSKNHDDPEISFVY
jgi:MAP/microtubule affinity-regulating kinase